MKSDRNNINPFTGKKHFNIVNDDNFLNKSSDDYNNIINQSQLLDKTSDGQLLSDISLKLIDAVEKHLLEIGRNDYTENYYDWEFHLVSNDTVNAFCLPGGKILVYSGILSATNNEESLAFILGHEMAHALLDHGRTRVSTHKAKNVATTAARLGSVGLGLLGLGEVADVVTTTTNVADIGAEYLLIKPWGREHEIEADKLGMMIINWAGYDISRIPEFWQTMSKHNSNNFDFFSTHPSDSKRIDAMEKLILELPTQNSHYTPVLSKKSNQKTMKNNEKFALQSQITGETPSLGLNNRNNDLNHIKDENILKKENKDKNDVSSSVDKFCSQCGNELNVSDIFCSKCGKKLSGEPNETKYINKSLEKVDIDEELKEKEIRRLVKAHSKTFSFRGLEPATGLLDDDEILKYAPKSIAAEKIQAKRAGKRHDDFSIMFRRSFGLK